MSSDEKRPAGRRPIQQFQLERPLLTPPPEVVLPIELTGGRPRRDTAPFERGQFVDSGARIPKGTKTEVLHSGEVVDTAVEYLRRKVAELGNIVVSMADENLSLKKQNQEISDRNVNLQVELGILKNDLRICQQGSTRHKGK